MPYALLLHHALAIWVRCACSQYHPFMHGSLVMA